MLRRPFHAFDVASLVRPEKHAVLPDHALAAHLDLAAGRPARRASIPFPLPGVDVGVTVDERLHVRAEGQLWARVLGAEVSTHQADEPLALFHAPFPPLCLEFGRDAHALLSRGDLHQLRLRLPNQGLAEPACVRAAGAAVQELPSQVAIEGHADARGIVAMPAAQFRGVGTLHMLLPHLGQQLRAGSQLWLGLPFEPRAWWSSSSFHRPPPSMRARKLGCLSAFGAVFSGRTATGWSFSSTILAPRGT